MTKSAKETYQAARKSTSSAREACEAVLAAHPDLTAAQVADLCWHVETGGPAPEWIDAAGGQTQASRDWDRGAAASYDD